MAILYEQMCRISCSNVGSLGGSQRVFGNNMDMATAVLNDFLRRFPVILLLFSLGFQSCEMGEGYVNGGPEAQESVARINLNVEGAFSLTVQEEALVSPENPGPVRFTVSPGAPDHAVATLDLDDGTRLTLSLTDRNTPPDWYFSGTPFDVYPSAVQADRFRYLQAGLSGTVSPEDWVSHSDPAFPKGNAPAVLTLLDNSDGLVYGRIRDLQLAAKSDPAQTIRINGTFVFPAQP